MNRQGNVRQMSANCASKTLALALFLVLMGSVVPGGLAAQAVQPDQRQATPPPAAQTGQKPVPATDRKSGV
jgi:hypothetical protein